MPLTSYCLFLFPLLLGLLILQVREPKVNLVYRYKDGGGMSRNNPTRKRHEIKGPKTPSNFNPSAFEHALLSVCLTDSVLSTSNSLCLDLSLWLLIMGKEQLYVCVSGHFFQFQLLLPLRIIFSFVCLYL